MDTASSTLRVLRYAAPDWSEADTKPKTSSLLLTKIKLQDHNLNQLTVMTSQSSPSDNHNHVTLLPHLCPEDLKRTLPHLPSSSH